MKTVDLLRVPPPPKSQTVTVTEQLGDEMDALPPGKVLHLKWHGREFVIIDRDDFDHIAAVGGMGLSGRE